MFHEIDYMIQKALGHKANELICLIRDESYLSISSHILSYCVAKNIPIKEIILNDFSPKTKDLPLSVKKAFLSDSNDIIILASKHNLWHNDYRKKAKYEKNKRLINLLHPDSPCPSYISDSLKMQEHGLKIKELLETAKKNKEKVRIYTDEGTDLVAKIGEIFYEHGDYTSPSSGGDYPAGEVGFGPILESVNGTLVYNYKIQHIGMLNDTIKVKIKNDEIDYSKSPNDFKELLSSHQAFKYICEISLGINFVWSETINKHSIIEEKNLGTIHFGHGGNFPSYGTRKGPHFDAVIKNPTVIIGRHEIITKGVFNKKLR